MENKSPEFLLGEIHGIVKGLASDVATIKNTSKADSEKLAVLDHTVQNLAKVSTTNSGLIRVSQDHIKDLQNDRTRFTEILKRIEKALQGVVLDHTNEGKDTRKFWFKMGGHAIASIFTLALTYLGLKFGIIKEPQ